MAFQSLIGKIDDRLSRFSHWKWRYFVLVPVIFLLVSILYYAFCFRTISYYEVYQTEASYLRDYCGFASLGQAIAFFVLVLLAIIVGIVYMVGLKKIGRLNAHKRAVFFAFLLSSLSLCVVFTLKVNAQVGHVDWSLWDFYDSTNPDYRPGHWGVILDIFRNGTVENFPKDANGNYWLENQYYQNKFWHYLLAYFMRFNGLFIHAGSAITADAAAHNYIFTENEDVLFESTRILVGSIGIWTAVAILKLLEKLGAHHEQESIAMGLFAFTPFFIMLPSIYNNDSLSFLFTILALYWAIDWHEHFSWHAIILIALNLGLGMATKFNAGVMALPIAGLFVYELVRLYQKKEAGFAGVFKEHPYRNFWLQILSFAVIVFPLGLFFAIYQYKEYGIPFGYVWDNGSDAPNYISSAYNYFIRFFIFPSPDMFFSIFPLPYRTGVSGAYSDVWGTQDFNIWTGFFKSALFNQANLDSYPQVQTIPLMIGAYFLYIVFFLLALYGLVYFFWHVINFLRGHHRGVFTTRHAFLWAIALTEAISFIYFNYRYPYACTSHCRYILEFFFPLYLLLGSGLHKGKVYLKFFHEKHREKIA